MANRAAREATRAAQACLRAAAAPATAAKTLRISPDAVAHSRIGAATKTTAVNPWRVVPALPGVLPDAKSKPADQPLAMDYAPLYDDVSGGGYGGQIGLGEGVGWFGYPYLTELSQRPEYRSITEAYAREMTRRWMKLVTTGDDDKTERLGAITRGLERFKIRQLFHRIAEHDGFFGKGHIYVDTGASESPAELMTPLTLDPRKIKKRSIRGFRVIEPTWAYPGGYNSRDPLSEDFYRPTLWYMNGRPIHRTRLLTFVAREMGDLLKPAYQFGGLSRSQMAHPAVANWLDIRANVGKLIGSFSVFTLGTDMGSTLAGTGGDDLFHRVQLFNNYRTNDGTFVYDKAMEEFGNISAQLGTLDKLQAQSQEHVYSISKIPLVVGTGITPSGLNASSAGELEVWNTNVHAEQWALFGPNLKTVLDLIQLNECGDIDPEIGFEFLPLGEMSEMDRANLRKVEADTAAVMIGDGVLLPEEERQRVATSPDSLYANLDLSVELPSHELEPDPEFGEEREDADATKPDAPEEPRGEA